MLFKKFFVFAPLFLYTCFMLLPNKCSACQLTHYYCTAADTKFFDRLRNLIGSIHRFDFENLGEIAVFDLGLTQAQKSQLKKMQKVSVHAVEITHPDILKQFVISRSGRLNIGHFAWKPVVIKQALELFPYVLYLDAGLTVLKRLDDLFDSINKRGYFFVVLPHCAYRGIENWHSIKNRTTTHVIQTMLGDLGEDQRNEILQKTTISAGIQGVTRRLLDDYVVPIYKHSFDISLFKDDGSAPLGWGEARHDQSLYSIYVHRLHYELNQLGWSSIDTVTGPKQIHIFDLPKEINKNTIILLVSGVNCRNYIRYTN